MPGALALSITDHTGLVPTFVPRPCRYIFLESNCGIVSAETDYKKIDLRGEDALRRRR